MKKVMLYLHTLRYLRPSQIWYRLGKYGGLPCTLGTLPGKQYRTPVRIPGIPALDFDPVLLSRFSPEDLIQGRVTLLYETESHCWEGPWEKPNRSRLWNFHLHYFEFLLPLAAVYEKEKDLRYLDAVKESILGWIRSNPVSLGGDGWAPYTLSLRLTNWLSLYSLLGDDLGEDFRRRMGESLWEQYHVLSRHLEKDLLGNHYFENLKALILCSLFFREEAMVEASLGEMKRQCRRQLLPGGMHAERSSMYHKLVLEALIRVCAALRWAGKPDRELEGYLQIMADAAWSLEEGLTRLPQFHDGGDNIAKSLDALMAALKECFGIVPKCKSAFDGYHIFRQGPWKLIVDAGGPGPDCQPGHSHCALGSFELFRAGIPVAVNCGTYGYQCRERSFFRSTAAHNTVMVQGVEQSQCWGTFRMAKRARVMAVTEGEDSLTIRFRDQKRNLLERTFCWEDGMLTIRDRCEGKNLCSYLHLLDSGLVPGFHGSVTREVHPYSPEYGKLLFADTWRCQGREEIRTTIQTPQSHSHGRKKP